MQTIHKYQLDPELDKQKIEMPQDARTCHVDYQNGLVALWAQVNTENPMEERTFIQYPLDDASIDQRMEMHQGAAIHHIGIQSRNIALWTEQNPAAPTEMRTFTVRGTGQPRPEIGVFVGTVMQPPFVWHIYEVPPHTHRHRSAPAQDDDTRAAPKRYPFTTGLQPLASRAPEAPALDQIHRGSMTPGEFAEAFGHDAIVDAMCMESTDANGFPLTLFVNHVTADENDDSHQIFFAQALLRAQGKDVHDHRALTGFLKKQAELTPEAAEMLLLTAAGGYSARDADMAHMAETAKEMGLDAGDYLRVQDMA